MMNKYILHPYWALCVILMSLTALIASCVPRVSETFVVDEGVEGVTNSLPEINICFTAASGSQGVVWYAYEKGLFKKHSLNVNLTFISGAAKAVPAMISEEMDFCQIAGSAVVSAAVAGEDLIMIGGLYNTYVYSLMVDPTIRTSDDLKGKAVAINKLGGSSDAAMREALANFGLKPDEDVALLAVGGHSERLAAMETGQVAGTLISVPQTVEAKERGYKELLDMSTLNIPYQHTGIATTKNYIETNREIVANFMKAITEAVALMKEDKTGTVEVMAQYLLLDVEEDASSLNETYDLLIQGYLPQAPYPTLVGIQTLLTKLEATNVEAANFKPEDIVDMSIVQGLEESGFINELYGE